MADRAHQRRKRTTHVNPYYGLLLSLATPIICFFLNPGGDIAVGTLAMLVVLCIAALALALDNGIRWWLIVAAEAALWSTFNVSAPSLGGDFSRENMLWLAGAFVSLYGFNLVISGVLGMAVKALMRYVSGD